VDQRRAQPTDDVLSKLALAERNGRYSRSEVLANAQSLIDAGHETTVQLIGAGTLAFMRNRHQWELLRSDPARLAESATEECLRYDPPLVHVRRVASRDFRLHDRTIRAGQRVRGMIASANRDPREFRDPDRFDIKRSPNRHIAFGAGIHFCLGQYLARVEGQEVFKALATRFPSMRLCGDGAGPGVEVEVGVKYAANPAARRRLSTVRVCWS
jgi:cytochrome P450